MTGTGLAAFHRRCNTCCNEHRFEDLPDFVAPDVVINGTDRGLDAYAEGLRSVVRGFPDYRLELGTHRGPFHGVEPTGRSVDIQEFAFYRVDADRIAEVWGMAFHVQLLEQLRA